MRLGWFACLGLVGGLVACDSGDAAAEDQAVSDSFQDDDIPMGDCEGQACPDGDGEAPMGAGANAADVGEPCDSSTQCAGGVCAAPYTGSTAGELVCQAACIGVMDDASWCSDATACCDANAVCSPRGFCIVPESDDDSAESDGTTGAGSESGSESGSDDGAG